MRSINMAATRSGDPVSSNTKMPTASISSQRAVAAKAPASHRRRKAASARSGRRSGMAQIVEFRSQPRPPRTTGEEQREPFQGSPGIAAQHALGLQIEEGAFGDGGFEAPRAQPIREALECPHTLAREAGGVRPARCATRGAADSRPRPDQEHRNALLTQHPDHLAGPRRFARTGGIHEFERVEMRRVADRLDSASTSTGERTPASFSFSISCTAASRLPSTRSARSARASGESSSPAALQRRPSQRGNSRAPRGQTSTVTPALSIALNQALERWAGLQTGRANEKQRVVERCGEVAAQRVRRLAVETFGAAVRPGCGAPPAARDCWRRRTRRSSPCPPRRRPRCARRAHAPLRPRRSRRRLPARAASRRQRPGRPARDPWRGGRRDRRCVPAWQRSYAPCARAATRPRLLTTRCTRSARSSRTIRVSSSRLPMRLSTSRR